MPIALIGLPGSGKTTVGKHLARRLRIPFVDSDQVLEAQLGLSIREYFEQQGEAAFRDEEERVIRELLLAPQESVLSTGGGVVLRPGNRQRLHSSCQVVYLRSAPEDIFRRLRHDTTRPLLQVGNPLEKLRMLFEERDPLYRETAHFVLETGRPSVPTLVNMIVMQLELAGMQSSAAGGMIVTNGVADT